MMNAHQTEKAFGTELTKYLLAGEYSSDYHDLLVEYNHKLVLRAKEKLADRLKNRFRDDFALLVTGAASRLENSPFSDLELILVASANPDDVVEKSKELVAENEIRGHPL